MQKCRYFIREKTYFGQEMFLVILKFINANKVLLIKLCANLCNLKIFLLTKKIQFALFTSKESLQLSV